MIRALIIVLVLAAGSYGVLWGFLYYRTMTFMDDLAQQVSERGELTYGAIAPDVLGKISVSDIRFQLLGANDDVRLDRASLVGPDALFFVQLFHDVDLQQGRLPERFGVHLQGLRVDVQGDTVRMLQSGVPDSPAADGCDVGAVGTDLDLLRLLEVGQMVVDTDFGWHHDKGAGRVTAEMEMVVKGIQSVDMTLELADVAADGVAGGFDKLPTLAGFDIGIKVDEGFGNRFAKVCAERRQVSTQEFKSALVQQFKQQLLAVGIEPGFGISYAIDAFYRDWGELRLTAAPARPVGVLSLMALPPQRLVDALGMGMTVNGSPVADFKFTWHGPQEPALAGIGGFGGMLGQHDAALPDAAAEQAQSRAKRPRYRKTYRRIGLQELPRYVSFPVRIKSIGQPVREGLLASFDGHEIRVQQRLHGGKFTAYVSADSVESIEVQVRVRVNPEPAAADRTPSG